MENTDGGKWGQNIALYIIAGVILVALFIWLCHKSGEDKANLAGAVQSVTSRVNAIEPAVTANANNIYGLSNSVARANQSIQFLGADVANLDDAVYVPSCGHGRGRGGCGCGTEKFRKESTYTLDSTTLTEVDTCNN
jgi:outer membrane murein-binding lipoprotein Lpp